MQSKFFEKLEAKIESRGGAICFASLNDPIPAAWGNYVTQSPVALEVIQDVLYDSLVYTSASTTSLLFFAESFATVKRDITNMSQPGMLPNPESFLVQAPRIFVKWTPTSSSGATVLTASVANDLALLFNTAICTLKFGNKQYGPFPAWMFSAGGGPQIVMSGTDTTTAGAAQKGLTAYAQLGGPLFALFPNVMISPLQNFNLLMEWPSGAVTLGAGNPTIQVVYEGQRARAVQ